MENIKFLNEVQVSEMTGKAIQTLRNERHRGRGIAYYKVGRSVRYLITDVQKYMEVCRIETADSRSLTNN